MKINTERCKSVVLNNAISAYSLEKTNIGLSRTTISKIRRNESKFENLTLETVMSIQKWIDEGNYRFSYDYSDMIKEIKADIEDGLVGKEIYIVRGEYNELLETCPIVDYYYASNESFTQVEKALTADVLKEMYQFNNVTSYDYSKS